MTVLEGKDWVCFEILDLLHNRLILGNHHPSNVGPKEPLENSVWIIITVGDEVVASVIAAPLDGRILKRTGSKQCIEQT